MFHVSGAAKENQYCIDRMVRDSGLTSWFRREQITRATKMISTRVSNDICRSIALSYDGAIMKAFAVIKGGPCDILNMIKC